MDDPPDGIDKLSLEMAEQYNRQRALFIGQNGSDTTRSSSNNSVSDEFESLGDGTLYSGEKLLEILMDWGKSSCAINDTLVAKEIREGIIRHCGQCANDVCRGGPACESTAENLGPLWHAIHATWDAVQWRAKAKKCLARFVILNGCQSFPSTPADFGSPSMLRHVTTTMQDTWPVYLSGLNQLWEVMGNESERKMWMTRLYLQDVSRIDPSSKRTRAVKAAWTGFALTSQDCASDPTPLVLHARASFRFNQIYSDSFSVATNCMCHL
jgi:hypothetical protein